MHDNQLIDNEQDGFSLCITESSVALYITDSHAQIYMHTSFIMIGRQAGILHGR